MAEKEREENFAKVIDFPKEVRVYGQISHVYFEGKDKFTTLVVERNKTPSSSSQSKKEKSAKEPVLIVPIKQKNSEVHFVKVPLQKLSKTPKAEKLGESSCPKVNLQDGPPKTEKIAEYRTNLKEIRRRESFDKIRNDFDTCFVFQQSDPFQKDLFSKSNLPIADLFRFQERPKLENSKEEASTVETSKDRKEELKSEMEDPQPFLTEKPSVREAETNTDEDGRLMKFLISQNKQKKMSN